MIKLQILAGGVLAGVMLGSCATGGAEADLGITSCDSSYVDLSAPAEVTVSTTTPAEAISRVPPVPSVAFLKGNFSGYCEAGFDISLTGSPENIEVFMCTHSVLSEPTVKSIKQWVFKPRAENGIAVVSTGIKNKVTYQVLDSAGNILPVPPGC